MYLILSLKPGATSLDEGIYLFEELVEQHPSFAEPRDELAQSGQTASEPLHALDVAYGTHARDGHDLFRAGLKAMLGYNVSQ